MYKFLLLIVIGVLGVSCVHEPFAYNGAYDPNDTINRPGGDTCDPLTVYFNDVSGIFEGCAQAGCHDDNYNNNNPNAKFSLTNYNLIVDELLDDDQPKNWFESDLYEVLVKDANDPDKRMPRPPLDPLTPDQIALLRRWVEQGATSEECGGCDTINVTYINHIRPMYVESCKSCHAAGNTISGIDLSTYTLAKNSAQAMLTRMKRLPGDPGFMPQGRPKNACDVNLMEIWIVNNTPE